MKTIERLRELMTGCTSRPWSEKPIAGTTREGVPCFVIERELNGAKHAVISGCGGCEVTRRDTVLAASAVNALPALLAVVEAAEELKVWTVPGDGIRETELASDSFANAALDGLLDAIRALNGETT